MTYRDFTYNCTTKEAWDAYALTLPEGSHVAEYGYIPAPLLQAPPGTDENDPVFDGDPKVYNVNLRADDELYPSTRMVQFTNGNADVIWQDPSTITNPVLEWSGGMDYWTQITATEAKAPKKRGKTK